MEVHFSPDLERRLTELASQSGVAAEALVHDVIAGYVNDLSATREMLDRRYEGLKDGSVAPIDGEAFFEDLRRREEQLLQTRSL